MQSLVKNTDNYQLSRTQSCWSSVPFILFQGTQHATNTVGAHHVWGNVAGHCTESLAGGRRAPCAAVCITHGLLHTSSTLCSSVGKEDNAYTWEGSSKNGRAPGRLQGCNTGRISMNKGTFNGNEESSVADHWTVSRNSKANGTLRSILWKLIVKSMYATL